MLAEDDDNGNDDGREDVEVCGFVEEVSDAVDEMITAMETLENSGDTDFAQDGASTRPATSTTAAASGLGGAGSSSSTLSGLDETSAEGAACPALDVGTALDAALENGIDGFLSTIGDDRIVGTSSGDAAPSDGSAGDFLVHAAESDQHYMFYSAETEEMIDTFLRSAADGEEVAAAETAVLGELQAVQLSAEDWREAEALDGGTEGMLVELDSSLLTIIELENDQMPPVDTEACLTVAPGGGLGHVVSEDEITAWNVFHGGGGDLGVSEFQVVTSEDQAATPETPTEQRSPKSEHDDDDCSQNAGDIEQGATSPSTTDPEDARADAAHSDDDEKPSNSPDAGCDDEYVLIVDCVDGGSSDRDDELEYEIVDEAEPTSSSGSAATSPDGQPATGDDDVDVDDAATDS